MTAPVQQCQPDNREVRRINGEFYAKDGIVHRAPVHTKTETGTNISVGFPVCEPSDYVDAEQLAGCLNEHEALKSRVEELTKALEDLQSAETTYRMVYDLDGYYHQNTLEARAKLRSAGYRARSALSLEEQGSK